MFYDATAFSQSLSWVLDTTKVTTASMFTGSSGKFILLNFSYVMSDTSIQEAVTAWCSDMVAATAIYGDISTWVTSEVTDMMELFFIDGDYCGSNSDTFNGDIGKWDTSRVTSFYRLFRGASAFNQVRLVPCHHSYFVALFPSLHPLTAHL